VGRGVGVIRLRPAWGVLGVDWCGVAAVWIALSAGLTDVAAVAGWAVVVVAGRRGDGPSWVEDGTWECVAWVCSVVEV
jgi:hypothetical protein